MADMETELHRLHAEARSRKVAVEATAAVGMGEETLDVAEERTIAQRVSFATVVSVDAGSPASVAVSSHCCVCFTLGVFSRRPLAA